MAQFGNEAGSSRRILVIYPGALGDLVCLVPTLRAIASRNAGGEIELMARAELARFAVGRLGVARGHSIDRREVSHLFTEDGGKSAEARAFFGSFEQIYSFFADDDARFRRALAAVARGAVSFLPFRAPGAGHVAQCYLGMIGADDEAEIQSRIDVLEDDLAAASRTAARIGLVPGEFMLIFPGSGSPKKNWPAENFAAIAQRAEPPIRPLIVLGPAEAAIEPVFRARFITLGGLELREVAGLARLAIGFVGNDSGVSHLAAAAGARGIALFGPTDPVRWRPLGNVEVLRHEPLENLPVEAVEARLRATLTMRVRDG